MLKFCFQRKAPGPKSAGRERVSNGPVKLIGVVVHAAEFFAMKSRCTPGLILAISKHVGFTPDELEPNFFTRRRMAIAQHFRA